MHTLSTLKIALIGGGNMARGLIGGLLGHGATAARIIVSDPFDAARQALERDFGVKTTDDSHRRREPCRRGRAGRQAAADGSGGP